MEEDSEHCSVMTVSVCLFIPVRRALGWSQGLKVHFFPGQNEKQLNSKIMFYNYKCFSSAVQTATVFMFLKSNLAT